MSSLTLTYLILLLHDPATAEASSLLGVPPTAPRYLLLGLLAAHLRLGGDRDGRGIPVVAEARKLDLLVLLPILDLRLDVRVHADQVGLDVSA